MMCSSAEVLNYAMKNGNFTDDVIVKDKKFIFANVNDLQTVLIPFERGNSSNIKVQSCQ